MRSFSAVMCSGVSIDLVLRVHIESPGGEMGPGFRWMSPESRRVDRKKDEGG